MAVLEQGDWWVRHRSAAQVSVAVPLGRRPGFFKMLASKLGLGVISIGVGKYDHDTVRWPVPAPVHEVGAQPIKLLVEQTTGDWASAGVQHGDRCTPFKKTVRAALEALQAGPLTGRQLVEAIQHHYASDASARASLVRAAQCGLLPGVVVDTGSQPFRLVLRRSRTRLPPEDMT